MPTADAPAGRRPGPVRRGTGRDGRRRRRLPGRGRGRTRRGGLGPAPGRGEHGRRRAAGAPPVHAEPAATAWSTCSCSTTTGSPGSSPRRGVWSAPVHQRPGGGPAAGGPGLPGRMGRPGRPAGAARLHPGAAPGPVRGRPGAGHPRADGPGHRPGRRRRVRAEVRGRPGGGGRRGGGAAAAAAGALGRGPPGEPDRLFHGHEQRYQVTGRVRRRRAGSSAWTPRSTATSAPTRSTRSPARSSR